MVTGMRYRLAGFELLPDRRELVKDGVPLAVGGRAFDLLCCLVENHGRTVTKDELLCAVWPCTVVTENNLNAQVRALRKVLGASAVVTVSGRGFRCGLDVQVVPPPAVADEPVASVDAIAVLPFHNLSGHPAEDEFADGMAEDLLTALSGSKQLRVVASGANAMSRARDNDVRELRRIWGVQYVLCGSVRRSETQLRIHARLVETELGSCLWSARWDGHHGAWFDLQNEITARVTVSIEPAIRHAELAQARRRRPGHLAAHDLVLQALPHLYAMRPRANALAVPLLQRALLLDPDDAWVQAHVAWCYEQALTHGWPQARLPEAALSLARQALDNSGDDAVVMGLAGFVMSVVGSDPGHGLAALRRAASLNPYAALVANLAGTAHLFAGDLAIASEQLERVLRLSPTDPAAFMFISALACTRLLLGESQQALRLCADSAALNPDWDVTWWIAAAAASEMGQSPRVRSALHHLQRLSPGGRIAAPNLRVFKEGARRDRLLAALRNAGAELRLG